MSWEGTPWHAFSERVWAAIEAGMDDEVFDCLAMELFALQAKEGSPGLMKALGLLGPAKVESEGWRGIPPVPQALFKHVDLSLSHEPEALFLTSGTTVGLRGKAPLYSLDWYRRISLRGMVDSLVREEETVSVVALLPSSQEVPESSLSTMVAFLMEAHGDGSGGWFVREGQLDGPGVTERLLTLSKGSRPVVVVGTAFAWVHLCDFLKDAGIRLALPSGSRVMETGGFKGRSREVSPQELHGDISAAMGVSTADVINEYGMTELTSQLYTGGLCGRDSSRWWAPPWVRVRAMDPETGDDVPVGELGFLAIYDLANITSVVALQTLDMGRVFADGSVQVVGRAAGASARGCSLDLEAGLPIATASPKSSFRSVLETIAQVREKATSLEAMTVGSLVDNLERISQRWLLPRAGLTPEEFETLADSLGLHPATFQAGLESSFQRWLGPELLGLAAEECDWHRDSPLGHQGKEVHLVVAASTVPTPFVFDVYASLLVGAGVVVKVPDSSWSFAQAWHHTLRELAPELAGCVELVQWDGARSVGADVVYGAVDRIVINGSDETVDAIRREAPEGVPRIERGTKISIAVLPREALEGEQWALGFARDGILWEQRGCLSPSVLYVEEGGALSPGRVRRLLEGALTELREQWPRRRFSVVEAVSWMETSAEQWARQIQNTSLELGQRTLLEDELGKPVPLVGGYFQVIPVSDLSALPWEEWEGRISTVVVPTVPSRKVALDRLFAAASIARVCRPGEAQSPRANWKNDGMDVLRSLKD